jgi:hypothetical protein
MMTGHEAGRAGSWRGKTFAIMCPLVVGWLPEGVCVETDDAVARRWLEAPWIEMG